MRRREAGVGGSAGGKSEGAAASSAAWGDWSDPLGPRLRALFEALSHGGDADGAAGGVSGEGHDAGGGSAVRILRGEAGREKYGTRVRFELRIQGPRVCAVRYRAFGCPHTLATCEWLARRIEGRLLEEVPGDGPLEWAVALSVPEERLGRLLVIQDALRAALTQA